MSGSVVCVATATRRPEKDDVVLSGMPETVKPRVFSYLIFGGNFMLEDGAIIQLIWSFRHESNSAKCIAEVKWLIRFSLVNLH